jgi:hypothetical protein
LEKHPTLSIFYKNQFPISNKICKYNNLLAGESEQVEVPPLGGNPRGELSKQDLTEAAEAHIHQEGWLVGTKQELHRDGSSCT